MEVRAFLRLMDLAEAMKNNTRHSWTSSGRHESVAEHSWRLALMAFFVKDEYPQLDMNRVIQMCLLHDMGEAFTGDIPAFEKTEEHEKTEEMQVKAWVESLPESYRTEVGALFREMEEKQSPEAKLYKALDKMEALIQHNEADISSWIPLEYELQLTYGQAEARCSEYTKRLRAEIEADSRKKMETNSKKGADSDGETG